MTLQTPFLARLTEFNDQDGTAKLRTANGVVVKCGATSFLRRREDYTWAPVVGAEYQVVEASELPILGWRASLVIEPGWTAKPAPKPFPKTSNLDDVMSWFEGGADIAAEAASQHEVHALEHALGRSLPASLRRFLRTRHWFRCAPFTTFAAREDEGAPSMLERTAAVHRHVEETLANPLFKGEPLAEANARLLLDSVAIAEEGNALPLSDGLFADAHGTIWWMSVKEFMFVEAVQQTQTQDFEAWVCRRLAMLYAE